MKNILSLLLSLVASSLVGQYIGYTPIKETNIRPWIPKISIEYDGNYHFGDSEGESTLSLFHSGTHIIAQIKNGTWNVDGTDWVWVYKNLSNVKIDSKGTFSSDEYHGHFVFHSAPDKSMKCLQIYDSWSGVTEKPSEYELGWKINSTVQDMFPGNYTQASLRVLTSSELSNMSYSELQLMRNEIFARYGYQFKEGGTMGTYFRSQKWYRPQHSNVNEFLSILEKQNLELIQKIEQEMKE